MRTTMLLMLTGLLLASCSAFDIKEDNVSIATDPHTVSRVAVIDFNFDRLEKGKTERGKISRPLNAGEIVADIFTEHLLGTGLYEIISKERINSLLKENNLRPSDLPTLSDWRRIRDLLEVDGIVLGVVSEYGDWRSALNWGGVSVFTARLVDISSGSVLWSVSANHNLSMENAAKATHAGAQSAMQILREKMQH